MTPKREDQPGFFRLEFHVSHDGQTRLAASASAAFHLFPELPTELRLQIWTHLILPRVVAAVCTSAPLTASPPSSRRRTPALLHVNREARTLALAHYAPSFVWAVPRVLLGAGAGAPARVWFNARLDALLLRGDLLPVDGDGVAAPLPHFLARADRALVRRVAVALNALRPEGADGRHVFDGLFHVVDGFPAARRVLVTCGPGDVEAAGPAPLAVEGENVVQRIWRGWISGTSVVSSSLADKQILMIAEEDLPWFDLEA